MGRFRIKDAGHKILFVCNTPVGIRKHYERMSFIPQQGMLIDFRDLVNSNSVVPQQKIPMYVDSVTIIRKRGNLSIQVNLEQVEKLYYA